MRPSGTVKRGASAPGRVQPEKATPIERVRFVPEVVEPAAAPAEDPEPASSLAAVPEFTGDVLVLSGDVPLLDADTVLLVREYAAGLHRYELGLVKGRIDAGETALQAANRDRIFGLSNTFVVGGSIDAPQFGLDAAAHAALLAAGILVR